MYFRRKVALSSAKLGSSLSKTTSSYKWGAGSSLLVLVIVSLLVTLSFRFLFFGSSCGLPWYIVLYVYISSRLTIIAKGKKRALIQIKQAEINFLAASNKLCFSNLGILMKHFLCNRNEFLFLLSTPNA